MNNRTITGKIWRFLFALVFLLVSASSIWAATPPGYHLAWGDEFNGTALDASTWRWGSLPWGGQHHNDQYSSCITAEDSYLQNGSLILRCRQGSFGGYPWSEGFVHSNTKYRYHYGYAEIRARWAIARGTWPAFWTLSDGWPPEFDIAEPFGSDNRMHMGLAYGACCPVNWDSSNLYNEGFDQWHTYGLEWGPGYAKWYMDGVVRKTINATYVPDADMYLILNSGMRWDYDGSTPNPNQSEIDYCRVYLPGSSTPPTITDLGNRTTATNLSTPPLPFSVGDAETPADLLMLTAASGNTTLVPNANIVLGGAGSNRTVTVTPAAGQNGSALITLSLFDGEFTVSETFTLTVGGTNTSPVISPIADLTLPPGATQGGRMFTVWDREKPAESLTNTATSSNPDLIPPQNISFFGTGSNRAVEVRSIRGMTGSSVINVTVSDGQLTAQEQFRVTVAEPNNLVEHPGFEDGITGYTRVFGGTLRATLNPVHDGKVAGALTGRGDWYHGLGTSLLGKLANGRTYRCAAWVRLSGTTNDNAYLTVRQTDHTGTHYYRVVNARASSSLWTRIAGDLTPVIYGDETELTLYVEGPAAGVDLFVDDFVVTPREPDLLVPKGAQWRYRDDGVFPGATWTTREFNDSSWTNGTAHLGYGDGDEATVVSFGANASNKHITTWFRHWFTVTNPCAWSGLQLKLLRDDGAAVYLNGAEIIRSNLPAGPLSASTLALAAVGGDDETRFYSYALDTALLRAGTNVLAVEIHQSTNTSSDISFDLELRGTNPSPLTLVAAGSMWKYNDTGIDLGTTWRAPGYDDRLWPPGFAQFGYGDGDEATVVSFGPSSTNKYITTYFRHGFVAPAPTNFSRLVCRLLRDDGAAVYLNGIEIWRNNLPTNSAILYNTLAVTNVSGSDETTHFYSLLLAPGLLAANGTNLLAVEVHQASSNSTDLSFDLELAAHPSVAVTPLREASGELALQWPLTTPGGFSLQYATNLSSPGYWLDVANTSMITNGQYRLALPIFPGTRFYRLKWEP